MRDGTESTPLGTTKGPSAIEIHGASWNDTAVEVENKGEGPSKARRVADYSPYLKRKRARLDAGKNAFLKRRGQCPWLSSVSSSSLSLSSSSSSSSLPEDETRSEVRSDVGSHIPAKLNGAAHSQTFGSSPLSNSCEKKSNPGGLSKTTDSSPEGRSTSQVVLSFLSQAPGIVSDGQEWEITEIVDRRRIGKDYEYKVCWKDTWLPQSELGNARRLLRKFDARRAASRRGNRVGRACGNRA